MKLVGLTGGIASGKSTVTKMFRALGAPVIDADEVARQVVAPGTEGLRAVAERFPGVVRADGMLDRKALGARVFGDAAERGALNALLHPRIQTEVQAQAHALEQAGRPVALYDAALLIENGLHLRLDGVILVSVPRDLQRARLMARDGLTEAEAEARLQSQLPLEEKAKVATYVVDNSGTPAATERQVASIWQSLQPAGPPLK